MCKPDPKAPSARYGDCAAGTAVAENASAGSSALESKEWGSLGFHGDWIAAAGSARESP